MRTTTGGRGRSGQRRGARRDGHVEGGVNLANVATHGGAAGAEAGIESSDSSDESDSEAATQRDHQLDEKGVARCLLRLVNLLEDHPHAIGRLKELVDRHPLTSCGGEGPPHPPWPLRKGLAAAEGRVECRKPPPERERRAGPEGCSRGGARERKGGAGDNGEVLT